MNYQRRINIIRNHLDKILDDPVIKIYDNKRYNDVRIKVDICKNDLYLLSLRLD